MKRRTFLKVGAGAFAGATFAPALARAGIATSVSPVVETTNGSIFGLLNDGVHTFLGVHYGKAPVGPLRFMPPEKPDPVVGPTYTGRLGHSSMQLSSGGSAVRYPGTIGPALDQIFGSRGDIFIQGEDCLVLNVWSPALDNRKRPVMVWFHGGGFNYGSGSWPAYNGHNLAKHHDVVVVTVNHRLNGFGFLNLAEFGDERYKRSGNAGQLDLVASLEWVRDNVANFGGDPDNVTIFGQSGGGAKVSYLMAMPSARGLFHKAIIQSGSALRAGDPEAASKNAKAVLDSLGIAPSKLSKLHDVHADDLLAAIRAASGRFGPIMDGEVIANHPFEPEASPLAADVPVMVGFTKDEMTLYNVGFEWWRNMTEDALLPALKQALSRRSVGGDAEALLEACRDLHPDNPPRYLFTDVLTCRHFGGASTLAERKAAQPGAPAYLYEFAWEAPLEDKMLKAPHTAEIPFAFDNVDKGPIWLGTKNRTRVLGRDIASVWVAFAQTGNPNTAAMPKWPAFDSKTRPTMYFDTKSRVIPHHREAIRKLLQT